MLLVHCKYLCIQKFGTCWCSAPLTNDYPVCNNFNTKRLQTNLVMHLPSQWASLKITVNFHWDSDTVCFLISELVLSNRKMCVVVIVVVVCVCVCACVCMRVCVCVCVCVSWKDTLEHHTEINIIHYLVLLIVPSWWIVMGSHNVYHTLLTYFLSHWYNILYISVLHKVLYQSQKAKRIANPVI